VRNTGARPHIEHGWNCSLLQQRSLRKVESKSAVSAALFILPLFFPSLCLFFIIDKRRVGSVILETYTNSSIESVFLPWKFQFNMWKFASIPGNARDKFMPSPFIIHHV
jgi:hypothetical protein